MISMWRRAEFWFIAFSALLGGCDRSTTSPDVTVPRMDSTPSDLGSDAGDSVAPPVDVAVLDTTTPDASDASAGYERPALVTVPPLPRPNLDALPRDDAGRPVLVSVPGAMLSVDPSLRDPIYTLATCAALIAGCVSSARSLDACAVSAPLCATSTPWRESLPCCPSACRDRFEAERSTGTESLTAFRSIYFDHPDCFPGVLEMLGETP